MTVLSINNARGCVVAATERQVHSVGRLRNIISQLSNQLGDKFGLCTVFVVMNHYSYC